MTPITKKIISLSLIALLLVASISLALPESTATAASTITATATPGTQSGVPGSTLTFSINLVNQDTASDVTLTPGLISTNGWPLLTAYPNSVPIAASGSASMVVTVQIPADAAAGLTEIITLNLSDGVAATPVASVPMVVNVVAPGADMRRPQLAVNSFTYGDKRVTAGTEFELALVIENRGQISAFNNTVTFSGEGFFPIGTGGMQSIQNIEPGGKITFYQKFLVSDELSWSEAATITVAAQYSDSAGTIYNNTFTLTIPLAYSYYNAATATPKANNRPQLVITGNSTDIDPLQPGSIFELNLDVMNLGNNDAKSVIMVLGGGASTVNDQGTPQASTGGADLTNFAPLGSSNIVVVGDIAKGASTSIKQKLVVNVSTVPGAYTLKTSFVYTDANGTKYVDDQVITLLVYSLPQVEINFYRDPGALMVGMPGMLPIQVTNLGKKTSVLGNMKVTSPDAEISNNVSLVGALESGGYYTLDAEVIPVQEGTLNIDVTINYTDDFNQPREIVQTIQVEVMAEPVMTPDPMMNPEMPVEPVVETFWSKVGRFFKGLLGLNSSAPEPAPMPEFEEMPADNNMPVIVAPKG